MKTWNYKIKLVLSLYLIFLPCVLHTQEPETFNSEIKKYDFSIFDGTIDSFTMQQMDINYLSVSRIVNRGVEKIFDEKEFLNVKISDWINFTWPFFINPMTHEEGHRSILTAQKIGSISQPFYNLRGAAYVKGVTNQILIDFRDSDRPSFVRMYTAGMESDYMMARREEMLAAFELDTPSVLYPDFFYRCLMVMNYHLSSTINFNAENIDGGIGDFFKWIEKLTSINEEENEFSRDICGFDTFGATRALFQDDYEFKRYVQYSDLTEEEKNFVVKRVAYRSFLNLFVPFLYLQPNFKIGNNISLTGSVGYTMAPFGDFFDENIYFKYRTSSLCDLNFHFYARQAENYKTWYPAFGIRLMELSPFDWLSVSAGAHIWWQPTNLSFYSSDSFFGGAGEVTAKFILPQRLFPSSKAEFLDGVGFVVSMLAKSEGFMPEIEQHGNHFRMSVGLEIIF